MSLFLCVAIPFGVMIFVALACALMSLCEGRTDHERAELLRREPGMPRDEEGRVLCLKCNGAGTIFSCDAYVRCGWCNGVGRKLPEERRSEHDLEAAP
jgi:hypothetical protein